MKKILFWSMVSFCSSATAAPHDIFLTTQKQQVHWQLTGALDAVNDSIDLFDLRAKEGISGDRGDYIGAQLSTRYQFTPQLWLEGQYHYREIDYSPDTNRIHSGLIGVGYTPNLELGEQQQLDLRVSFWGNQADQLNRSAPTAVNQYQFEQVNVKDAKDWQVQLDAIFSHRLDPINQINFIGSIGYSDVSVDAIDLRTRYRGCLADLQVDRNNQFQGHLVGNCQLSGHQVDQLHISGNAQEYGLDLQKDLNYSSIYASIGLNWLWQYRNIKSQAGYQYQYLWRDDVDQRVQKFGSSAIKDNHTLGLKFSYALTPHLDLFVQGEMYQHNFVGQIPLLYNGVTASRLDRRYGLASLGLTLHRF